MTEDDASDTHSYFIPMVDLLAGVVFILIIMLAAVSLTMRPDFTHAEAMQKEIAAIQQKLDAARAEQKRYLGPRRIAEQATALLLQRLADTLRKQDISVQTRPAEGMLILSGKDAFSKSGIEMATGGDKLAQAVSAAILQQLPCLAPGLDRSAPVCSPYPQATLQRMLVTSTPPETDDGLAKPSLAEGRALNFLTALMRTKPQLLRLRAPDGTGLYRYAASISEKAVSPAPRTTAGATSSGDENGTPASRQDEIRIIFSMDVPPIPVK